MKSAESDEQNFDQAVFRKVNEIADQLKFCQFPNAMPCENGLKMDLAFVIDSSSSIGKQNFEDLKKFVVNIVNRFEIGSELTRVSEKCDN